MKAIKITAIGTQAFATEKPVLTSGTVGQPVEFTFGDAWDGLLKTAVFRAGNKCVPVEGLNDIDTVPWEVMETPNVELFIGVFGTNGDGTLKIPTVWCSVGIINQGTHIPKTPAQPPTPQIYDQILAAAGEAVRTANALRKDAENGCFNGAPGKTPVKGEDYFTPEDQKEMVNAVIAALPTYNGEVEDV